MIFFIFLYKIKKNIRINSGKQADVAQVVAHLIGNEEVTGPSPVISFR